MARVFEERKFVLTMNPYELRELADKMERKFPKKKPGESTFIDFLIYSDDLRIDIHADQEWFWEAKLEKERPLAETPKEDEPLMLPFNTLPKGTRFKYPDGEDVWVVLETHGRGLIARWEGIHVNSRFQPLCSFADDENWFLDSLVEVIE